MGSLLNRFGLWLLVLAWGGAVIAGLGTMVAYETTAAPTRDAGREWPAGAQLDRDAWRPTLVVFVHPHCPCSRASLAELAVLASECADRLSLLVVFVQPAESPTGSEGSGLWRAARDIRGAVVVVDEEGGQADLFRATTSGEAFLYAADGRLLFHGGLTASRGHEGANAGRSAIASLVQRGRAEHDETPVFGCALQDR
jgi:hypothetical protein